MEIYCKKCEKTRTHIKVLSMGDREVEVTCPTCYNVHSSYSLDAPPVKEPIKKFKSMEEGYKYLREWQTRLFLDDWTIKLEILPPEKMELKDCAGETEFQIVNQAAIVRIADLPEDGRDYIQKTYDEETVVHELLHCKYNWIKIDSTVYESVYFDTVEHALLEQTAKSLIMAKYNLPFGWFQNFSEVE